MNNKIKRGASFLLLISPILIFLIVIVGLKGWLEALVTVFITMILCIALAGFCLFWMYFVRKIEDKYLKE